MPKQLQQHIGLRNRIFIYGPTPTYKQKQGAINECFQVICLNIQKKYRVNAKPHLGVLGLTVFILCNAGKLEFRRIKGVSRMFNEIRRRSK